ncbi:MAG: DNA polymerase III subunit alpha [Candidatus Wildermuthbacteria bacterium GWA2_46_15]|uniref:DNA polymerase III subunit alpha n=1 Tax=Candidatus Wildermuthbacteria bacterium GWA2_46_15 TaxID=1802443 RepID=A0A1G2QMZ3_9BACT|nr:MAG: DNA polymerase III subunit alpha [Candidatus Wildermuthbacteria bacterium GWA2_46_15]
MAKFTHLHVHSQYSLLDGLPKIPQLLNRAKELGMDSLALTDHGVLYGAVEFYKEAIKRDIKPIIGAELYVANNRMTDKRPNVDDKRYHLVLLAKNEQGYKNLIKLITKAHLEGFYYKPRIDEELLREYSQGLIGLSACLQGRISRLIMAKKLKEAEETALRYQEIFGPGNFYLELQHHENIKEQAVVNRALIGIAKKTGLPTVATQDMHYLKLEDAEAQDVLMLINTGADPNDPERLTMKQDDFSMSTPEQMEKYFQEVPEAIENTQKIADACNFKLELGKTKLPAFNVPDGKTANQYLRELVFEKIEKRYLKPGKDILERVEYELSVIEKTGFASYFLIVQDLVNWAKENRIVVGPGRGSAAGSIISYILGITNVDPIKYNLLFERFLNPERISFPDIDLDFADRRRDEVINYVAEKYGRDKVAQIITFGTMAARAVVRDVGRALGYPYAYCDQMAKMIPFGLTLEETLKKVKEFRDLYEQDAQAKKLVDLAKKLEGVARHASTHACGVVISAEPLENIVPLQHPTQNDENIVTQYEMHSIEDLGLLKMDFLGLKNLTIIEDTLARIYVIHGKSIDIETIPLDNKDVYKTLREGRTAGLFQLESSGMTRYLVELKPTEFEDIVTMITLFRPGPMEFIPSYIKRKHGKEKVTYLHPKLKPILEKTYGICIYQESLMQIARDLAGFTYGQADVLRKAVGKKIKSLLDEQKDKLLQGMKNNGISDKIAQEIWEWILPFAYYGFNRSHSCAYAMIAYQTAYLKTLYPVEFMAALLTSEKHDVEKIAFFIEECKQMKIDVLPPDINESLTNFTVVPSEKKVRFGLSAIKNVGANVVKAITEERKANGPFKNLSDFLARINSKDLNKKSLESLARAGVFDSIVERNQILSNVEDILEFNRQYQKKRTEGQRNLFEGKINFGSEIRLAAATPASPREKLEWEKELLGLFVTSHPLDGFRQILKEMASPLESIVPEIDGKKIKVAGIISRLKKIIAKNGQPMLFINLEDLTAKIEVVVFPSVLERNPLPFKENKIVFITGRVSYKDNSPKIICDDIQEILEQ